jgi:hypothetical protein
LIAVIVLSACNSKNQEPVYEGMTIVQSNQLLSFRKDTPSKSMVNPGSSMDTDGEIIDDEQPLDEDIEDLAEIEIITDDQVKYYVSANEVFIVQIHLSNPNDFEIQSFTLNGKKYANYMFKDGSTMELLLLEVTAPSTSGYIDYTIDAIKYIDGTEIKDVKMEGNQTIKAGIQYNQAPSVTDLIETKTTTSMNITFDFNDSDNISSGNEVAIYLSDGETILDKQDVIIGSNDITFSNLTMGTTYEYGIVAVYDLVDGQDKQVNWLTENTFATEKAFTFTNFVSTKTSISFDWSKLDDIGTFLYFNLYHASTNELISKIDDTTIREITELLSDHGYIVEGVFQYTINEEVIQDSVKLQISTEAKTVPTISLVNQNTKCDSIEANIDVSDPDSINTITKVELYSNDQLVTENQNLVVSFFDLSYFTDYSVMITYQYDLNDGVGTVSRTAEITIKTDPYFNFSDVRVLNTTAVSEGDTIILQANIENPSNALYSKVVVNGIEYNVSPTSTQNRLRVEIVNNGQFSGGNTELNIEEVLAEIGGNIYRIEVPTNSSASVFINGNLELLSIEFVNENFETLGDYIFPSQTVYLQINLNNPTGYDVGSIIVEGIGESPLYKIDNNTYYRILSLDAGWNTPRMTSISYSNQYITKQITVTSNNEVSIFKVNSDEIHYVHQPEDLLNMNQGFYYELANEIDLSGINWFGNDFNGVFNGKGYSIKNMSNVASYQNQDLYLGLFRFGTGVVENLKMKEITIIVDLSSSIDLMHTIYYGGIIARTNGILFFSSIEVDEYSSISIKNNASPNSPNYNNCAGGLFGSVTNSGSYIVIRNSHNGGSISADYNVGGFLGSPYVATISNSFNSGTITGKGGIGGLIGQSQSASISDSYNSGAITGTENAGGLIGKSDHATISNSYSIDILNEFDSLIVTVNQLNTQDFYLNVLEWDPEIWNFEDLDFENNVNPTLRDNN